MATNEKLVLTVPQAGKLLRVSRATAYMLANQGVLPVVRLGHSLRVPVKALEALLDSAGKAHDQGHID